LELNPEVIQATFGVPAPRGVVVRISPEDQNNPCLSALQDAFRSISVAASFVIPPQPPSKGEALLIVGFKPLPLEDELRDIK
jgi:hypothetical protein